jgi:4-amino-4-deoxy-L-arabinose transferase-like glycosyltransferase
VQRIAKSPIGSIVLLLAVAAGTLFFRLGALPLSGNDEPRYARIAEEMYETGSWITPTLQHRPWLEKPPLYYWATIPFESFIHSRETAARLAPAFFALIAALAVFWLGCRLYSRLSGLIGASVLLTSLGHIVGGRTAATDMPFTCCLTLCLVILASAVEKDPGPAKILAAYAFLGLAALGKGPVAIVLATGIGMLYWYFDESGRILRRWRPLRGALVFLLVSVPWFWLAFRENGFAFIATFFVNHNLARYVTEIHHHAEPFWFYLPVILLLLFPWSGWLPLLLHKSSLPAIRRWKDWDHRFLFLVSWCLFPLIFFSLSGSKLAGYILPSLPPLALLLGIRMARWVESDIGPLLPRVSAIASLLISAAMAVAAPIYFLKYGGSAGIGLMLSAVFLVPSILAACFAFRDQGGKVVATVLIQGILLIGTTVQFAVPLLGDYMSARSLAEEALNERLPGEAIITFGITDHSLDYYTGYQVLGKVDDTASILSLLREHGSILAVTEEQKIGLIEVDGSFSTKLLGQQGELRLLRMTIKGPGEGPVKHDQD